jgi:hypothetical protein
LFFFFFFKFVKNFLTERGEKKNYQISVVCVLKKKKNFQKKKMPNYFPHGVPAEDPHAWANDSCFLTRLAQDASARYNSASPAIRSDIQSGASLSALSCVARVVDDSDEQVSQMLPRLAFHQYLAKMIRKSVATFWHRWWHPNEVSGSLLAQYGDNIDLSTVPADQLRIALSEAINTGDEGNAANIAAELARRREAPGAVANNQQQNSSSALSRAQSISQQRPTTRANSVDDNDNNNNFRNQQQNMYLQQDLKKNPFRTQHFSRNGNDDDEDNSSGGVKFGSLWGSEKPMWK